MPDISGLGVGWTELIGYVGVIGSLIFNAVSLTKDAAARRTENQLRLKKEHREIWALRLTVPALKRVDSEKADLEKEPLTAEETIFVGMIIQQLSSSLDASGRDMLVLPEQSSKDTREFFSLPIPAAVWKSTRNIYDEGLVAFVENSLRNQPHQ